MPCCSCWRWLSSAAVACPRARSCRPVVPSRRVPEDAQARAVSLTRIGDTALRSGEIETAVGLFEQATLTDGRNVTAALGLGDALLAAGRDLDASRAFERALAIQPEPAGGELRLCPLDDRDPAARGRGRASAQAGGAEPEQRRGAQRAGRGPRSPGRPRGGHGDLSSGPWRGAGLDLGAQQSGPVAGPAGAVRRRRRPAAPAGRGSGGHAPGAAEPGPGLWPPGRHGRRRADQPGRSWRSGPRQQSGLLRRRARHRGALRARGRPGPRADVGCWRAEADPQEQVRSPCGYARLQ